MKRFKEFIFKILFPPAWVIVLTSVIGFPAVIISLVFLSGTNHISYISYVLSAYAPTVLCANFPRAKRRCKELIYGDEVKIIAETYEHNYGQRGLFNCNGNGCFYDSQGKRPPEKA